MKTFAVLAAVVIATAVALSALWKVPYLYTLIGFSAWAFFGHLVTADDDVPGGWSNPHGEFPFPWAELILKGVVLVALCAALLFASIRSWGGE